LENARFVGFIRWARRQRRRGLFGFLVVGLGVLAD
jgi:hypothetical protein